MRLLFQKEIKLAASPLSFFFTAFSLMAFIPGYPILLSAFFVCFGIFQSFQSSREAGDILYTALLPVKKSDVVRSKFAFTIFIQLAAFILMAMFTFVRMKLLQNVAPYTANAMMNANVAFLGYVLVAYSLFNLLFIGGFFKTAYKIGIPFLKFSVSSLLLIGVSETMHHLPGFEALNSTTFDKIQLFPLALGFAAFVTFTLISIKISVKNFENTDL